MYDTSVVLQWNVIGIHSGSKNLAFTGGIAVNSTMTVFVCSTFSDLSNERERVLDAIRRLQLQHDSMEVFGARANQPIETCLREVGRSNILVVIVGHQYGSLVPGMGVSFSEAEYNEGYALNKPCLVYMRDENVPILPKHMERDPDKLKQLERWKKTLQKRHTVATFEESNDLAIQVAADIGRTISAHSDRTNSSAFVDNQELIRPLKESISDQAMDILRSMEEYGTEYFLLSRELGAKQQRLVFSSGPNYLCSETRFFRDNLETLVSLGLLREDFNRAGQSMYFFTRAASNIVKSLE